MLKSVKEIRIDKRVSAKTGKPYEVLVIVFIKDGREYSHESFLNEEQKYILGSFS